MKKILILSAFFTKSMLKERATIIFTIIAAFIIFISLSLSGTDIGFRYKLFEDILLTSQGYLFLISSVFYTFSLLNKNSSMGLFVLPVSSGITRSGYLVSIFLSIAFITGVIFIIFLLLDTTFLLIIERDIPLLILWQLFLFYLSSLLASSIIIALSNYVSLTNSILYAISLFMIGNALDELYLYSHFIDTEKNFVFVSEFIYYLFPNFSIFDFQGVAVNRAEFNLYDMFVVPVLYFCIWISIFFTIAYIKFKKKALTVGR